MPCSPFLRPVGAKVKGNHLPILLPLQGVVVYTLIPRALPWAEDWLPFQGAPFRALFVYHVRMLCHLLFGKKRAENFLYFEHPTLQAVFLLTYRSSEEEIVAEEEQNHEDDEADENAVDDAAGLACLACFAGLEFCLVLLVHGSKWSLCTQEGKGLRKGCS